MYNVGEKVVNKESYKTGVVTESKNSQVEVHYDDGSKQWVDESVINKLLLETDPRPNSTFIQDQNLLIT